jgi:hypothetical protein
VDQRDVAGVRDVDRAHRGDLGLGEVRMSAHQAPDLPVFWEDSEDEWTKSDWFWAIWATVCLVSGIVIWTFIFKLWLE